MSVDGIAAVQSRVQELRSMFAPATVTRTTSPTSTAADGSQAGSVAALTTAGLGSGTSAASSSGALSSDQFAAALAAASTSATAGSSGTGRASGTGIAPDTDVTAQDLIATAKKYLGVPYVWGGESLSEGGLDCSGLVLRSLTDLGIADGVPRTAREQQRLGTKVDSMADARPGDLLIFHGGTHIAIYLGDGKMIDAPKPGGVVNIRDVYTTPTNIRRILPQESATPVAASTSADPTRAAWDVLVGAAS